MHLLYYWVAAFATLFAALVLLNIYDSAIGNDLLLLSTGKEAAIAAVASLIEATGAWLIVTYLPMGLRAMVFPCLIVGIIYKIAHFEDWSKGDIVLLLVFQFVIFFSAASLFGGHFKAAIVLLGLFGAVLALMASFSRNL
jgi:hypothetical protein